MIETKDKRRARMLLPEHMRILVVEDEYLNQCLLISLMDCWDIWIAENGQEALYFLERYSFDLILMDIQMPVLDGHETTRIIRNLMGLKMPIIAVSADRSPQARIHAIKAGMSDFLAKPYDSVDLYQIIMNNMGICN